MTSQPIEPMKALDIQDEFAFQLLNLRLMGGLYHGGCYTVYKLIALILRTLLVGSSNDPALAHQCLANPLLPKLKYRGPFPDDGHLRLPTEVRWPGFTAEAGAGLKNVNIFFGAAVSMVEVGTLFDIENIPLTQWLDQLFLSPRTTLRDFLRTVVHKEGGAHVELDHEKLVPLQECAFLHWPFVAAMAEPIARTLLLQQQQEHPSFRFRIP